MSWLQIAHQLVFEDGYFLVMVLLFFAALIFVFERFFLVCFFEMPELRKLEGAISDEEQVDLAVLNQSSLLAQSIRLSEELPESENLQEQLQEKLQKHSRQIQLATALILGVFLFSVIETWWSIDAIEHWMNPSIFATMKINSWKQCLGLGFFAMFFISVLVISSFFLRFYVSKIVGFYAITQNNRSSRVRVQHADV